MSVVRLFPNQKAFMAEIRKMSRACPGRKRNKVLLLGGAYADMYYRFWLKDLEWINPLISRSSNPRLPSFISSDRATFDKYLDEGTFELERLQVVKAEGDVFAVVNKKKKEED